MKKTIVVDTVQSTPKTIVIQSKNGEMYRNGEPKFDKFKIWINDQDGNPSRAYTQYQELRPIAGDKFEAEVFEKESSFTNPAGKLINYTDRTINYFYLDNEGNPTVPVEPLPHAPQTPTSHVRSAEGITDQMRGTDIPQGQYLLIKTFNETLDKQRQAFKEMQAKVDECVKQVEYFKELWKTQNPDAGKVHADQIEEIPIIGDKENFADEASKKLFS